MKHSFKFIYLIAIIVVIMIIVTLGLFVLKSCQSFVSSANLNLTDTSEFNNTWIVYKGKHRGTDVKMMLQKVVQNAEANSKDASMLLDIAYKLHATDEFTIINSITKLNNVSKIKNLMSDLDVKHFYTIEIVYSEETDLISGIIIKYNQKDKINFIPDEN